MKTVPRPCKLQSSTLRLWRSGKCTGFFAKPSCKPAPCCQTLVKMHRPLRPTLLARKTQPANSPQSSSQYFPECILTDVVGNRTVIGLVFIPVRFGRFGFILGFAGFGSRTVRFAGSSSVPRQLLFRGMCAGFAQQDDGLSSIENTTTCHPSPICGATLCGELWQGAPPCGCDSVRRGAGQGG